MSEQAKESKIISFEATGWLIFAPLIIGPVLCIGILIVASWLQPPNL